MDAANEMENACFGIFDVFHVFAQARAASAIAAAAPVIVRTTGGQGAKDLHLENFSVSNGGAELIEVRLNR